MTYDVLSVLVLPFFATIFVSVLPITVLFLIPNVSVRKGAKIGRAGNHTSGLSSSMLNLMLSFAAGSLFGDALLHLLIHSIFEDVPSEKKAKQQMMLSRPS